MSQIIEKQIDEKHAIAVETNDPNSRLYLVKRTNGQVVPEGEPTILFRGRDKLAVPMLRFYRELCAANGCTDYQLKSVDNMIEKFVEFSKESPTMKQPGCTLGR